MSIPNIISLARLLSVPLTIWLILQGAWIWAFGLFMAAGISDAVDGFIAKRYNMRSELGRFLDPLADKALLVSIYVTLGTKGMLPQWLVIMVVSRDVLIVGGALLAFAMDRGMAIQPLQISKANTVAQITLAAVVLGELSFAMLPGFLIPALISIVAITTLMSGGHYLFNWARGQNSNHGGAPLP